MSVPRTSVPFTLDGEEYVFTPHGTRREVLRMTTGTPSLEWLDWLLGGLPEDQGRRLLGRLYDQETDDLDLTDLSEVVGVLARRSLGRLVRG